MSDTKINAGTESKPSHAHAEGKDTAAVSIPVSVPMSPIGHGHGHDASHNAIKTEKSGNHSGNLITDNVVKKEEHHHVKKDGVVENNPTFIVNAAPVPLTPEAAAKVEKKEEHMLDKDLAAMKVLIEKAITAEEHRKAAHNVQVNCNPVIVPAEKVGDITQIKELKSIHPVVPTLAM